MIDDALLDVACPFCPAQPLELCTVGGRYMESTVHYPRRIRAGVTQPERIARTYNTDPTKCRSGKHDWTPENTRTYADGKRRCHPCAAERQSRNKTGSKRKTAQTKRPRQNVQHRTTAHTAATDTNTPRRTPTTTSTDATAANANATETTAPTQRKGKWHEPVERNQGTGCGSHAGAVVRSPGLH